ncbi:MAG: hypothetical protein ACYSSN_03415 [Planctomycetota bacterium]|jgi:hypothetical protein
MLQFHTDKMNPNVTYFMMPFEKHTMIVLLYWRSQIGRADADLARPSSHGFLDKVVFSQEYLPSFVVPKQTMEPAGHIGTGESAEVKVLSEYNVYQVCM